MLSKRQSSSGGTSRRLLLGAIAAGALLVLIGVPATWLDRRELSPAEGVCAQHALGPLEHDPRAPRLAGQPTGPATALRCWGTLVGTTERSLRLLVVLGMILGALVTGEAAARLAGAAARPPAWLVIAASPLMQRGDLLHPGLMVVLPVALVLCGPVFVRGGGLVWLLASLLGLAAAPFLGPGVLVLGVLVILSEVLLVPAAPEQRWRPAGAATLQLTTLLGATALGPGLQLWQHVPLQAVHGSPEAGDLLPAGTGLPGMLALLAAAALVLLLLLRNPLPWELRVMPGLLVAGGFVAGLIPAPGGGLLQGGAWAGLLPPLALMAGVSTGGRVWVAAVIAAPLALVAVLLWSRYQPVEDSPMRDILDQTRAEARPGGRLVVFGPMRHGLLFYSRRGHDPGVPIISVPEDASWEDLRAELERQLGVPPDAPGTVELPVLVQQAPVRPPPGFRLRHIPGRTVARLEFLP